MSNVFETTSFEEKCNYSRVKALNAMDNENLKTAIFKNRNSREDAIVTRVKKYLYNMEISNGKLLRSYKLKNGNFKADGYSINGLPKNIRNYIFDEFGFWEMRNLDIYLCTILAKNYYEMDMKNCKSYLENRIGIDDDIIDDILNRDVRDYTDRTILSLSKEIDEFKNKLMTSLPEIFDDVEETEVMKDEKSRNMKDILEYVKYHNLFPQLVVEFGKKNIMGFTKDGISIRITDDEQTLKKLNKLTGCTYWSCNKEEVDYNALSENIENMNGYSPSESYESIKEKFERDHFIVQEPMMFCRESENDRGRKQITSYSIGDFKLLVKPWKFMKPDKKGGTKKADFLTEWLEDEDRRIYKKLDFIPDRNFKSKTICNLFRGFDYDDYDTRPFKRQDFILERFIELIGKIVGNEKQALDYVLKYIAHMIQRPCELPSIILLFKSIEGVGKDLMADILGEMLGNGFKYQDNNMDKVFGSFNPFMEKNLILVCNETKSSQGFMHKESIKAHATNKHTTINIKGKSQYDVKNNSRTMIFTNNINPVDISPTDRRFCVFQAINERSSDDFVRPLYELMDGSKKSRNGLYTLFEYFDTLDISDFNIRDRPITKAYKQMKERNVSAFNEFMYDIIINGTIGKYFKKGSYMENPRTKDIVCMTTPIIDAFGKYCRVNRIKTEEFHSKRLKSELSELQVTQKSCKMSGEPRRAYVFELQKLEEQLRKIVPQDEDDDDEDLDLSGFVVNTEGCDDDDYF